MKKILSIYFTAILIINCSSAVADPWFTGPILAPAAEVVELGHMNLEIYGYHIQDIGTFNRHGKIIHTGASQTTQYNPQITYGLTDKIDTQFSLPYAVNHSDGQTGRYIGDTSELLGFQLLEQKDTRWRPDLRITVQEIIPTGRYDNLDPNSLGTDGTGLGSYQTALGLNFQHLLPFGGNYYLRTRLALSYVIAQPLDITGLSTYGGTTKTRGKMNPGNLMSIDLAAELSVTQNWVAVMEGYYMRRQATKFQGTVGLNENGLPGTIGYHNVKELSLAPAIEYNFSANYGIIGGVWYSVTGTDAPDFQSIVIAFNAYW